MSGSDLAILLRLAADILARRALRAPVATFSGGVLLDADTLIRARDMLHAAAVLERA